MELTTIIEFPENPTDSPKTMFVSKDQWVEEGGRLRLFCEALVGEYTLFQEIQLHALLNITMKPYTV